MESPECRGGHIGVRLCECTTPAETRGNLISFSIRVVCVAFLVLGAFAAAPAAEGSDSMFSSPEEAVKSLVSAVRSENPAEMAAVLGLGSEELISSGDDVADRADREKFLGAYDEKHGLREESPDKVILYIGAKDWPMPIPIVKKGTDWVFDVSEGKEEILNRRIGGNELYVIDVVHAYVDAQHEYASRDLAGSGAVEFASKLVGTEGKHDGLYWPAEEGELQSPLGPLVAQAAEEGYPDARLSPFHGYYFKILREQGPNAEGGAYHYLVNGKMILGFALVAYPAEYDNSGVMTFIVNQEGVVYQKDLGEETRKSAEAMNAFDPDESWSRVSETETHE